MDTSFLPLAFVFGLKGMDRSNFNWFFPYLNRGEVRACVRSCVRAGGRLHMCERGGRRVQSSAILCHLNHSSPSDNGRQRASWGELCERINSALAAMRIMYCWFVCRLSSTLRSICPRRNPRSVVQKDGFEALELAFSAEPCVAATHHLIAAASS